MALLFAFIAAGYVLQKLKVIPDNSAAVLSKLENFILIPASVLATFMRKFTVDGIGNALEFFIGGFATILISIPFAILISRLCSKDSYIRKIYTYGIAFSNFGFMGYAVVRGIFGDDVYANYLIFVIPFWMLIYVWGVPTLLIPAEGGKKTIGSRLKAFLNPMFIAMIIGMIAGILLSAYIPKENTAGSLFIVTAIDQLGNCMSPVAMLLTGMTIAKINLKSAFSKVSLYVISLFRLIIIPLVFIAVLIFLPFDRELKICILCVAAMPLGLNTIVIPNAYGLDTTMASGMALISHLLSCISIPIIFMLFDMLVKA